MNINDNLNCNNFCNLRDITEIFKEGYFCKEVIKNYIIDNEGSKRNSNKNLYTAIKFFDDFFKEDNIFLKNFNLVVTRMHELEELNIISLNERRDLIQRINVKTIEDKNNILSPDNSINDNNLNINLIQHKADDIMAKLNLIAEYKNQNKYDTNNTVEIDSCELEHKLNFIIERLNKFEINVDYENPNIIVTIKGIFLIINGIIHLIEDNNNTTKIKQIENDFNDYKSEFYSRIDFELKKDFVMFSDYFKKLKTILCI